MQEMVTLPVLLYAVTVPSFQEREVFQSAFPQIYTQHPCTIQHVGRGGEGEKEGERKGERQREEEREG